MRSRTSSSPTPTSATTAWSAGSSARPTTTDFDTQGGRRRIACHELGHTVGLRHWNQYHSGAGSCMFTPPVNATTEGLSQHDRDHINAYYS
jgi:hypothetical protein